MDYILPGGVDIVALDILRPRSGPLLQVIPSCHGEVTTGADELINCQGLLTLVMLKRVVLPQAGSLVHHD